MVRLIQLQTFRDPRGTLTVIEKPLPFEIKRVFYIYGVDNSVRGKHRHHTAVQAVVCLHGRCVVSNNDGEKRQKFLLDAPDKCLILEPWD